MTRAVFAAFVFWLVGCAGWFITLVAAGLVSDRNHVGSSLFLPVLLGSALGWGVLGAAFRFGLLPRLPLQPRQRFGVTFGFAGAALLTFSLQSLISAVAFNR